MFTKKYVKQGQLLIRHAEKLLRYRRDVLSESTIGDFKLQVEALRQSLKARDEAKAKEESDRLHDLYTHHLPTPKDVAWRENVEVILVAEEDDEVNPAGVKGIGELANVGTAAAIANAVYHATGKRVRELPIRLEKLLA